MVGIFLAIDISCTIVWIAIAVNKNVRRCVTRTATVDTLQRSIVRSEYTTVDYYLCLCILKVYGV